MKTVDELNYNEVCKLLFDGQPILKHEAMKAMTIDLIHEATFSVLFPAFNILATGEVDVRDARAFRAALIDKYRETLERMMKE